jgi:hypothetical protein
MGSLRSIRAERLLDTSLERQREEWLAIYVDLTKCCHSDWLEESDYLPLSARTCDFVDWSYYVSWMHTHEYYPGSIYHKIKETPLVKIRLIADICRSMRHLPLKYGSLVKLSLKDSNYVYPPLRYGRKTLHNGQS